MGRTRWIILAALGVLVVGLMAGVWSPADRGPDYARDSSLADEFGTTGPLILIALAGLAFALWRR